MIILRATSAKALEWQMFVWDECTMSHNMAFEAMDRTLQDIRGNKDTMGLASDFRQTLPVIPRGTRADELQACLKSSYIWRSVIKLHLFTNIRAYQCNDQHCGSFAGHLLQLGDGKLKADAHGAVDMKDISTLVSSVDELISKVFPDIYDNYHNHK